MNVRCLLLAAGVLCLGSCVIETSTGPTRHDSRTFDRGSAERLSVNLNMGAGNLKVRGGSSRLAQADFAYNVDSWKPEVRYSGAGAHGSLTINQPGHSHSHFGSVKYEWDLALNDDIPVDLTAHFGAGEARLDLGSLALRSVEVEMGVGELRMDLRGKPRHDYDVHIRGGIGEATIHLPANVGVYAVGSGGIGEIKTSGLRRDGDHWVNDAYEESKTRIHLDIRGGIGSINLIAD
ncbi:MAG: toast rack family protein [Acidobacteriia bacterium]|nr:toast rack family protein [Terriglobia bacterium]